MKQEMSDMLKKVKFEIREVTPEEATTILERHYKRVLEGQFVQRPITPSVVARFMADVTSGNWLPTPQGIAINVDGDLLDGQHRLEAIRRSKKSAVLVVSTGWPVAIDGKKLINNIDTGKTRTIQQMMHLHGLSKANAQCSIIRAVATVALTGQRPIFTYSSMTYLMKELGLSEAIEEVGTRCQSTKDFLGKFMGPIVYYYTSAPRKALAFATGIFQVEGTKGSGVQTFLKWHKDKGRVHATDFQRAICGCIRAWDANENINHVKYSREHVEWLSNTNPKLREQIRAAVPRTE